MFKEYKSTKHSTLKPQNGSTEEARRGAQVKTKEREIGRANSKNYTKVHITSDLISTYTHRSIRHHYNPSESDILWIKEYNDDLIFYSWGFMRSRVSQKIFDHLHKENTYRPPPNLWDGHNQEIRPSRRVCSLGFSKPWDSMRFRWGMKFQRSKF